MKAPRDNQPPMVVVRVSLDHRPANHGLARVLRVTPETQIAARSARSPCINFRHRSAGAYRWEFDKGKQSLTVAMNGPLLVDDLELLIRGALDGIGLAFMSEGSRGAVPESGTLVRVPEEKIGARHSLGFFLYCPSRRQQPGACRRSSKRFALA